MTERFLTRRAVCEKTTDSPAQIDRKEKAGLFPLRRKLGAGRIGWLESEVDEYLRNLPLGADLSRRTERAREVRAANVAAAKAAKAARDQEGAPEGGEAV